MIRSLKKYRFTVSSICFIFFFIGCQSIRPTSIRRDIHQIIQKSPIFSSYFLGIKVIDPETGQVLASQNEDKYFTPASNTKIVTLYTVLRYLADSTVSFLQNPSDPTQFIAMGDGTFLHADFSSHPAFKKLASLSADSLTIFMPDFSVEKWGPGWGWDDFAYDYQAERNLFPLYGNCVEIQNSDTALHIIPSFFRPFVQYDHSKIDRAYDYNVFYLPNKDSLTKNESFYIPIKTSLELSLALAEDTLGKKIQILRIPDWKEKIKTWIPIYNQKMSSVLAIMMQRSDNFYAEQLLIQAALVSGAPSIDQFISRESQSLNFLPQPIYWFDGSGLSRYNLVTPAAFTTLLTELYTTNSWQTLASTFPVGGVSGTIKNWYAGDPPYIYAKTGTLKNNHCLSGYLITKSGKTLIFSLMHNHYTDSTAVIRTEMQKLLEHLRDAY